LYEFVVTPLMRCGAPDISVVQFGNDSDGCEVRTTVSNPCARSVFTFAILREASSRRPSTMM
jgi:hypothetical protein